MFKQNIKQNSGMLTIELLIAFAILLISITGIVMLTSGQQTLTLDSETNTEALTLAQKQIETAKANALLDFGLVNSLSESENIYQKNLTVIPGPDDPNTADIDESLFTKLVTSQIDWDDTKHKIVKLVTLITNPEAIDGGDTCNSTLSGDWTNPQINEYELGADLLGDPSSGFPVTSIQTFNKKMYVTVDNSHGNNDSTFFQIDISHAPILISSDILNSVDNNPGVKAGLNSVALDGGHYAYVTNTNGADFSTCLNNNGANKSCGQLQVIDLNTFTVVYTYQVPGVTGSGGQGVGRSVFYKNGIVYLGLSTATGPEFNLVDVGGGGTSGASPTSPKPLGTTEIGNDVNSIYVKNNYAYVGSPNNEELKIFKVSSPNSINQVGGFNASSGAGHGKSIFLVGNKLYLGKTVPNSGPEFHILDNTNPETNNLPQIGTGLEVGESVNGLIVRNFLAFLITSSQFQTWDITDSSDIIQYATPIDLPPGSGNVQGQASDCEGNFFYVGSQKTATGPGGQDKGYISIIYPGIPKLNPSITSEIHDAGHNVVTSIPANTTVHDKAVVSGSGGTPTGTVSFTYYTDAICSSGETSAGTVSLSGGIAHPSTSFTPSTGGDYSFRAHYNGNSIYNSSNGPCEPLHVNAPVFSYTLSSSPATITIHQGNSGIETITSTLISGMTTSVMLSYTSVPPIPASVHFTWNNNPCSPTCSNNLTIHPDSDPATKNKTYTITVSGSPTGGSTPTSFVLSIKP